RVTLRAEELRAAHQHTQLESFRQALGELDRRRDEALAVVAADLKRLRRSLDSEAATRIGPMSARVVRRLQAAFTATGTRSAAEVEDAGRQALVEVARPAIEDWRREQAQGIEHGLHETAQRQQELLDAAVTGIVEAAREHLGIELRAQSAAIDLPDHGRYFYSFEPAASWGEPVAAAVRRRLPGAYGRRRVQKRLRAEASWLVDMHVGRARADLQQRLEEAGRVLARAVGDAYTGRGLRLAEALDGHTDAGASGSDEARSRLTELSELSTLVLRTAQDACEVTG
ncbi:MAG TPA: hypothetical protein VMG58_15860, partial [Candidatus Sulfotelmatobacter sp.]|nr:hypothetical protein [Candidatus Sulfotelmatobacter sp.]